jgi:hypothetical protein
MIRHRVLQNKSNVQCVTNEMEAPHIFAMPLASRSSAIWADFQAGEAAAPSRPRNRPAQYASWSYCAPHHAWLHPIV